MSQADVSGLLFYMDQLTTSCSILCMHPPVAAARGKIVTRWIPNTWTIQVVDTSAEDKIYQLFINTEQRLTYRLKRDCIEFY